MQIPLPDKASREAILRRFVVYGGYELGEIRDNKVMASEQQLSEYVDSSLLSATVLQQAPHSDETIAPIISQLKFVLSYKVCCGQQCSPHTHQVSLLTLED